MMNSELKSRGNLRIGAAAKAAGVSVHTLRKWEERYDAVQPQRSPGGGRIYSSADVERLSLLKTLADAGLALREIAALPTGDLHQLMAERQRERPASQPLPSRAVRVAAVGHSIQATLKRPAVSMHTELELAGYASTLGDLREALDGAQADVLVVETPTLDANASSDIRAMGDTLGISALVVVYGFASQAQLLELHEHDVVTLRAPVTPQTLARTVIALGQHAMAERIANAPTSGWPDEVPAPRFSRETLSRITQSRTQVRCECPHHLAEILLSLRAFEDYCAQCENRSPEDAQLHRYLGHSTGQARAMFEEAMERLATAEGFEL